MSSIDLVILGIVMEKPQSAYDIQKDVEYHHYSRWTRVSVPSVYRKVIQLEEQGYLHSETVRGERSSDKAVYSITEKGQSYFNALMEDIAARDIPVLFDFNVMIANLGKMDTESAMGLVALLRESILRSAQITDGYAADNPGLPLTGRAVFEQQKMLYASLLKWLDGFEKQLGGERQNAAVQQSDDIV